MKYLDLCKPLYEERRNVVAGRLDDNIDRIHKERASENEDEERSKGYNDGGDENAGEGEEREGATPLDDASDKNSIYGAITSGQGTNTINIKSAKDNYDEEGRMVGIPQFWVCAMGHMEAISELITERDIEYLENFTDVTC